MERWFREFGPEFDSPLLFLALARAGRWEDRSWHNDQGPCFEVEVGSHGGFEVQCFEVRSDRRLRPDPDWQFVVQTLAHGFDPVERFGSFFNEEPQEHDGRFAAQLTFERALLWAQALAEVAARNAARNAAGNAARNAAGNAAQAGCRGDS